MIMRGPDRRESKGYELRPARIEIATIRSPRQPSTAAIQRTGLNQKAAAASRKSTPDRRSRFCLLMFLTDSD